MARAELVRMPTAMPFEFATAVVPSEAAIVPAAVRPLDEERATIEATARGACRGIEAFGRVDESVRRRRNGLGVG